MKEKTEIFCSFSIMGLIKNELQTKMGHKRLNMRSLLASEPALVKQWEFDSLVHEPTRWKGGKKPVA